ncbi:MAG: Fic family protein [Gammaproteobacteria bacterium]|nr:Fic family protein [Gammaproteobacteria bacterium]
MARPIPEKELKAIEDVVRRHPGGVTAQEIAGALPGGLPRRTLQYRLQRLVEQGRLAKEGERRWTKYRIPAAAGQTVAAAREDEAEDVIPLSDDSTPIREYLRKAPEARQPVSYNRELLDAYRPGTSFYLSEDERAHLATVGKSQIAAQPAGTYAKQILNRLLIDLSWNSSRLEGNTYSLLDTRRLIEFGEEAEGRDRLESQMILNHKDAIEFLVGAADDIGFNRYTILNLHAMLANNLLPDETAAGRLRNIEVGIERSAFHPLAVPQLIEECFDQILATTAAIEDPFEQAFFFMVQLPYLQPFDDVNKRVSRIAANIPMITSNLTPLSFIDVPRDIYTEAVLGVYELNEVDLLKDVFIWAYERSAARYTAVRQSLGEPDPFRLKYREALRTLVGEVVRQALGRKDAVAHIAAFAHDNVPGADREQFREMAENELLALHEGNYARYQIRPAEFQAWREVWNRASA